jgi:trimeric autotransporter adhesin
MNSGLVGQNVIDVALVGRVPCQVVGTIAKGDRLVASSTPGVATRLDTAQYQPGCIIGKALESYDSETVGTIEVAVGRF